MMDKQQNKTNAQQVKKQNQATAQGQYGTEFASETDAQQVKNTTKKLSKTNNKTANH